MYKPPTLRHRLQMNEPQCKQGGTLTEGPDGYAACTFEIGSEITGTKPACVTDFHGHGTGFLVGCLDHASRDVMGRMDDGRFAAYQICNGGTWHFVDEDDRRLSDSGNGWRKYKCDRT